MKMLKNSKTVQHLHSVCGAAPLKLHTHKSPQAKPTLNRIHALVGRSHQAGGHLTGCWRPHATLHRPLLATRRSHHQPTMLHGVHSTRAAAPAATPHTRRARHAGGAGHRNAASTHAAATAAGLHAHAARAFPHVGLHGDVGAPHSWVARHAAGRAHALAHAHPAWPRAHVLAAHASSPRHSLHATVHGLHGLVWWSSGHGLHALVRWSSRHGLHALVGWSSHARTGPSHHCTVWMINLNCV